MSHELHGATRVGPGLCKWSGGPCKATTGMSLGHMRVPLFGVGQMASTHAGCCAHVGFPLRVCVRTPCMLATLSTHAYGSSQRVAWVSLCLWV